MTQVVSAKMKEPYYAVVKDYNPDVSTPDYPQVVIYGRGASSSKPHMDCSFPGAVSVLVHVCDQTNTYFHSEQISLERLEDAVYVSSILNDASLSALERTSSPVYVKSGQFSVFTGTQGHCAFSTTDVFECKTTKLMHRTVIFMAFLPQTNNGRDVDLMLRRYPDLCPLASFEAPIGFT